MSLLNFLIWLLIFWLFAPILTVLLNRLFRKPPAPPRLNVTEQGEVNSDEEYPAHEFKYYAFYLAYRTTRFNTSYLRLAALSPWFWGFYFRIGVYATLTALVFSSYALVKAAWTLLQIFKGWLSTPIEHGNPVTLTPAALPIFPGITLEISHYPYFFFAILIAGLVHEGGYATAAVHYLVPIKRITFFLFIIYPGSYVQLVTDKLNSLYLGRRLRVVAAGIWNNLVVALIVWLLLWSNVLEWSWRLFGYQRIDNGVVVRAVEPNLQLYGYLPPAATILQIDDSDLHGDVEEYHHLLLEDDPKRRRYRLGYCVPHNPSSTPQICCDIDKNYPFGREKDENIFCFQPRQHQHHEDRRDLRCWHVFKTMNATLHSRCQIDHDCPSPEVEKCMIPYDPEIEARVTRITFSRFETPEKNETLVYIGNPINVVKSVYLTQLKPRWRWQPVGLPFVVETFFRYVMLFNLAFALITALPVKRFKGSTFLVIFTQRVFADHLAFIPRFIISTATFLLLWVVVGGAVYTLHSII